MEETQPEKLPPENQPSLARRAFCTLRNSVILMLVNLALVEIFLQLGNLVFPLSRPTALADTYANRFLEGDWKDGLNRLYVYEQKPGARTYGYPFRVNQWGFRDGEMVAQASENRRTFRIMVLGDSMTVGIAVAEENRYTDVLERLLKKKYPDVDVELVNLGVQGFETLQEYKILQRMWPIVRPDFTIVGFYENDPNLSYEQYPSYRLPVGGVLRRVLSKSLAFRLLDEFWDPFIRKVRRLPNHQAEIERAYQPDSRDWSIFEKSVQGIATWVSEHSSGKPLVINLSESGKLKREGKYLPVLTTFKRAGFEWIDLGDKFHIEPVSRFESHPNENTHTQYANALCAKIVELQIIDQWRRAPQPNRGGDLQTLLH